MRRRSGARLLPRRESLIGPVAIAAENEDIDAQVYRGLLELLVGDKVERWKTDMGFTGWESIEKRLAL